MPKQFTRLSFIVLILSLLAILPLTVLAEDGTETEIGDGYLITLPEGWEVEDYDDSYGFIKDDLLILLMTPDQLSAVLDYDEDSDPADLLVETYAALFESELDKGAVNNYVVRGRKVASIEFETEDDQYGISMVIELSAGEFGFVEFYAPQDQFDANASSASEMLLSFKAEDEESPEECLIIPNKDLIDVRVGPGTNRGVFTSLDNSEPVSVLGSATAEDGSLWYKLNAEVDNDATTEFWVAASDVDTVGDCDRVDDVNAPPMIPLRETTSAPAASGENTASNNEETAAPAPSGKVNIVFTNTSNTSFYLDLTGPQTYHFSFVGLESKTLQIAAGTYTVAVNCHDCVESAPFTYVFDVDGAIDLTVQTSE